MGKGFTTDQGQPLGRYLRDHITVDDYFDVAGQILTMLNKMQREGLQISLDMKTMQIKQGKVQFQMINEDSVYELESVRNFIKEMTFSCIFSKNEDCQKVSSFLHFLDNSSLSSSIPAMRDYCTKGTGREPSMTQTPQAAEGETGVLGVGFWKNLEEQYSREATATIEDDAGETGLLDPSYWDNALRTTPSGNLNGRQSERQMYGKLIEVKSGKTIQITKENFWIGKDDVDLQINKEIISRKHAVIISRGNHFFVSDNGSTNKTYVDGREIPAKASVEIFKGTRIKFANEEYEFQI